MTDKVSELLEYAIIAEHINSGSVVGGIALTGYATWFIRERLKAAREKR